MMNSLKKDTIQFIKKLLEDEIEREIIQDNPKPEEVEYIQELVKSTIDFINKYGDFYDKFYVSEKIEELFIKEG